MFGQDREQMRRYFAEVWRKRRESRPLEPLELLIAGVIEQHPEYHGMLEHDRLDHEYPPELGTTNPFLHMGMHIALKEQLTAGQPAGIATLYRQIATRLGDAHEGEHRMMECLGEALWRAQRDGVMPDEAAYLECLRRSAGD